MTPRLYTTADVCAMLQTTRTTVREMVKAGVLESPLRGRISIRSVEALLEDGRSWQEIRDEKAAAAKKAKARNGKIRKQSTGAGASGKTAKPTTSLILTGTGRRKNVID